MVFCLDGIENGIKSAIEGLCEEFGFQTGAQGEKLSVKKSERFAVQRKNGCSTIEYTQEVEIFVGLRYLLQQNGDFSLAPTRKLENMSVMCDCSRNAVMSVKSVKRFVRHLAMLGYNQLMLYTEDTYEVDGEPYFGHLRGSYTKAELKELDAYALSYGVTLIPCIQTLAHLDGLKNWTAEYRPVFDCENILLVGDERAYLLIENMFKTLSECFTTKLINFGMDEAWLLGAGKYLALNGHHDRYEIMCQHLNKVVTLAEKYGFKPFMWSDMFLRAVAKGNSDPYNNEPIPPEIYDGLPKGVNLIYWDYYHNDEAHYERMIDRHAGFNRELWFAGSSFTSYRFSADNERGLKSMIPAFNACVKKGVSTFCVTQWGDDGGDGSMFSALRSLAKMGSLNYGENDEQFESAFFVVSGGYTVDEFKALDFKNDRYLFYNDPFIGKYSTAVEKGYEKNYRVYAEKLVEPSNKTGRFQYLFKARKAYCEVMELKYDIYGVTRAAYETSKEALAKVVDTYEELRNRLKKFLKLYKVQWSTDNKPTGFEIQVVRMGGMLARLEDCIERIHEYLNGEVENIPELETKRLDVFGCAENVDWKMMEESVYYKDMVSVNFV